MPPVTTAPATTRDPSIPLDHLLAHRLAVAGRLVRTLADAELGGVGVAAPGCGVLLRLAAEDGLTQRDIARRQRVEAPTMCRIVDRLERDGLVERRPDPADRRATRVHLTAAGRSAAADGAHVVETIESRAFAGLDRHRARGARRPARPRHRPARPRRDGVTARERAEASGGLRLTLAGLVTAAMAFALMQTFLIPALPTLQADLHTTGTWVTWTVTIYLLTGSVATPIIGRLGDQHGKVRMMVIALAVFLVGSIAAIFAWNIGSLIVFRAVQGIGGAVFPLSFAIIRDEFPPERQSVAMGLVSAVLGVGGGVGIVASGLIVNNLSWRWLFVVSAAVVAAALVLVVRFVPESRIRAESRVDLAGALTLSGFLVCLLVGLTEGPHMGWARRWSSPSSRRRPCWSSPG